MVKFKIDENLPTEVAALLADAGYDAMTVPEQHLGGHPDPDIVTICQNEGRAIVTLDLDFADIRLYPPKHCAGDHCLSAYTVEQDARPERNATTLTIACTGTAKRQIVDRG